MQKWEYRFLEEQVTPKHMESIQECLTDRGAEGWELVGMAPITSPVEGYPEGLISGGKTSAIRYVLKRPKPAEGK
jgi:hypothetical protein